MFGWMFFLIVLLFMFVFFHQLFDVFLDLGVTFLMKLRSGGLLFREKGSMDDFRGSGWKSSVTKTCSWTPFGSILGGFLDHKSIKVPCIC